MKKDEKVDLEQYGSDASKSNTHHIYDNKIESHEHDREYYKHTGSKQNDDYNKVKKDSNAYGINKYTLYGANEFTWCNGDRLGSEFAIYDYYGYSLYLHGTISRNNEATGPCDLSELIPGVSYLWRTTGALNMNARDVSYEFCGVKAGVSTEVYFQVDCDGECVPIESYELEEICNYYAEHLYKQGYQNNDLRRTAITLQGSIYIEGIRSK
eukprot:CAMPEP_0182425060 /NCGR_PEP_ID=MMETSP1167-20130531/11396_1 /TAXON_ID=2988 /ORGANISM="Mallomonas Sp, Strain CCMP3275" /LENGTH=210 /DNA_ID=CAMNT_0024605393 /DNA_START=273 /DNA_END=902 /DNA_ORIENTATION=+